jgi:hypothetical protein
MSTVATHSADVRMELHIHDLVIEVGQLSRDFLVARTSQVIPPGTGTLHVTIDGSKDQGEIELPDGIHPEQIRTRIQKVQTAVEAA